MQLSNVSIYCHSLNTLKKLGLLLIILVSILTLNYYVLVHPKLTQLSYFKTQETNLKSQYKIRYTMQKNIKQMQRIKKHIGKNLRDKIQYYNATKKPFSWVEHLIQQTQQNKLEIINIQPLKIKQEESDYFEPIKMSLQGQFIPLLYWLQQQNQSALVIKFIHVQIKRLQLLPALTMEITLNVYAKK